MFNPKNNDNLSSNLIPNLFQSDTNKKFLQSTIDQLVRPGTVQKISGYIGRQNAKASTSKDVYIDAADTVRKNYQLEPAITIKDDLGNVTFLKDYQDYINAISVLGGNVRDHNRINKQEFYSWNPHIDWDKFSNFQQYYWLPYGPDVINITGQQQDISSTYKIISENQGTNYQWVFTPDSLTPNPLVKLYKGQTYVFEINSPGNPFTISTARTVNPVVLYQTPGLSDNAVSEGTITFKVPEDAPDILYYFSSNDLNCGGVFQILAIEENTFLDVDKDLLGKKQYTLPDGTSLSNGMKIRFLGNVIPEVYKTTSYYVEGVGKGIVLVDEKTLEIISPYVTNKQVLFDSELFDSLPFSSADSYAGNKDYIVVNRSSKDKNPWSRHNRWFHREVIEISAKLNGVSPQLDQGARAVRPIIEFEENLQLYNFGSNSIINVDLIDDFTEDVFSTIEGSLGYNVDGIDLVPGMNVLFTADPDPLVNGNVYRVDFLNVGSRKQIHLVLLHTPSYNDSVVIKNGVKNQSISYWYNGVRWMYAQQKTAINQQPLFDVVDENGFSFNNESYYPGSSFRGTKLFSYATGEGSADPVLGFPLEYRNISNIGDIVFNFNIVNDSFVYKLGSAVVSKEINVGFLKKYYSNNFELVNGWEKSYVDAVQGAVRIYKKSNKSNDFDIDVYDNINDLDDLFVKVYVNGSRRDSSDFTIIDGPLYKFVRFYTDLSLDDVVTIKSFSKQLINQNGFYEIPPNLQNNSLNEEISSFTLGEVLDHIESIVENLKDYKTTLVGSNLRDLGNVTGYGTKFVQHSGPISLALYHLVNKENNLIRAIEKSKDDYLSFKRKFINLATNINEDVTVIEAVDFILRKINENKNKSGPYYFSDMVPYGASIISEIPVLDYRIKTYPVSNSFDLSTLSSKSVLIYLNKVQLIFGKDYIFDYDNSNFIIQSSLDIQNGDLLTTYEFESTNGCYVPETPSKLGIYPAYEPEIFLDTTLLTPRQLIRGHDGSLTLTYGDYRDQILLELEKRIFNNIKVRYDSDIFDVYNLLPGYSRSTDYSLSEFNEVLSTYFFQWINLTNTDFATPLSFDKNNSITYNYIGNYAPNGEAVPGFWRGIYKWMFDTDRPNTHPWEMLGFTVQPSWWTEVYGPAPYTRNNLILWNDLSEGFVKEPNKPVRILKNFIRPILKTNIPVDENGNLLSPYSAALAQGVITNNINSEYVFGDIGPVENAWRRSSYYPYVIIIASVLLQPARTVGILFDRSRIIRNPSGQLVYEDTLLRINPQSLKVPSVYTSQTEVRTSGLVNFVVNYTLSETLKTYEKYKQDLQRLTPQLSYRLGAYSSKEKFDIILESRTPLSNSSSVFVPKENYKLIFNSSSPVKKVVYSGVIITKISDGFIISGYSKDKTYFSYYDYLDIGTTVNVGGVSESFVEWSPGNTYFVGQIVKFNKQYYRVINSQALVTEFNYSDYVLLKALPFKGGVNSNFRSKWNRLTELKLYYGKKISKVQDVVDFLLGYGEYLKDQGFIFDDFNNNLETISNWETSAKEFLFWTTQNWSASDDKWTDWSADIDVEYNEIVRYNGEYYQALQKIPATSSQPVINLSVSGVFKDYKIISQNVEGIFIGMSVTGTGVGNGALVQSITGSKPYVINLTEKNIGDVSQASFTGFFNENLYLKLSGLDTVGSSVISLSPSANKINFRSNLSVVNSIIDDFYPYSIFKVDGTPLQFQFIDTFRNENIVSYSSNNNEGIYSATFYLIQQEQVLILDNVTMFNDIIYSPSTGYRRERLKVSGYTSIDWTGGLNASGFIIDQAIVQEWTPWSDYYLGDTVKYQQYYYSANRFITGSEKFTITNTDGTVNWMKLDIAPEPKLIPNWSYKVTQFTDFYSLDSDNFDLSQQELAQHLIGYQKRQYLENIIQDSVGEFKFYQGMIFDKGTKLSLDKLFGVADTTTSNGINFYEEWAVRVGQYGSAKSYEEIEFVLNEDDFTKRNPQGYELVSSENKNNSDFINRLTPNDLYLKPINYNANPFPYLKNYKSYLRTAGYVRPGEVDITLSTIDDVVDVDINTLKDGSYIWCGFEKNSWNIYRLTNTQNIITDVSYSSNKLSVVFANVHQFLVGDYIGFRESSKFDGFHKISEILPTQINITVQLTGSIASPFPNLKDIVSFRLKPQRASSIDIADTVLPEELSEGELLWTDDNGQGLWTTWQNNFVYDGKEISYANPIKDLGFGREIAVSRNGQVAAIATKTGQVLIYYKPSSASPWVQRDSITTIEISKSNSFGINSNSSFQLASVLALSPDGDWLAIGSPTVSNACVKYKNTWSNTVTYIIGDIVLYNNKFYKSVVNSNVNHQPTNKEFWRDANYIFVDMDGTNSSYVNHGAVSLYKRNKNNLFNFVDTILSPNFSSNEQFGSSLTFDQKIKNNNLKSYSLYIGAKGYNQNAGRVYELKFNQNVRASTSYNPFGSTSKGIIAINIDEPGTNYTNPPLVNIPSPTDQGGIQATATCAIGVVSVKIIQSGSGYLPGDLLYINGGTFSSQSVLKVTSVNSKAQQGNIGAIKAVVILKEGEYSIAPSTEANIVSGGTGFNARFDLQIGISKVTVTDPGAEYAEPVFITFSGSGSGAKVSAVLGNVLSLSNTENIEQGMNVNGVGFDNTQVVETVINSTILSLNLPPTITPSGTLTFSTFDWSYTSLDFINCPTGQISFGSSITANGDTKTLIISSSGDYYEEVDTAGKVNHYKLLNDTWQLEQTIERQDGITGNENNFGIGIDISNDGLWLAIGDVSASDKFSNQGLVTVYNRANESADFEFYQTIHNIQPQANGYFGARVAWMNESTTLVVYSQNTDIEFLQTFDKFKDVYSDSFNMFGSNFVLDPLSGKNNSVTTFDGDATKFKSIVRNNGRVDIYDKYNTKYIYSETLQDLAELNSEYGEGFSVGNDTILVGAPSAHVNSKVAGRVFAFNKKGGQLSWKKLHQESPKIDLSKFKRALVYNKTTGDLVTYLDIIDPMQGKIPGPAEQELKYKTFYDPAIYSTGTSSVNVSQGQAWGEKQVGQLWWDLRTAKFIDAQDDDIVYRNNSWALLFPGASIDIYEWVSSPYTPSQWNQLADTVSGLSQNVSGQTLYNDTVYSQTQRYNNISKTYKTTYYFWVKNKNIIPNVIGRSMSASNVSKLIANPRGENYKFLAITGSNSFSLVNLKPILQDKNMVLSIEYWLVDNPDHTQIHRQYAIINDDINTVLPTYIEEKWIDSLCGKDKNGSLVPDPKLPLKLKYGVENRPRQSMFMNRFEALKQFIEGVNVALKEYQVSEFKDITDLNSYDFPPTTLSGLYDIEKDIDYDLRFVTVGNFTKPSLSPIISFGKIVGVHINSSGSGYVNPPYIDIVGDGKNAKIKSKLNALGQITGVEIIDSGEGYNDATTFLSIRSYSVLVRSDSGSQGFWSIFSYDVATQLWSRTQTQGYDVRPFWKYIDWYALGYNQYTAVDYYVNNFAELNTVNVELGQLVKVKTDSKGNWTLLEKYNNSDNIDYTQSYKTVGLQNGTIEFSSNLYILTDTVFGFDGSLYDDLNFDNSANQELRIILNTLKNKILTGELKKHYIELFFKNIKYAISEQVSVDWIFKTSFVKADHLIGNLDQTANYQPDNLSDYQKYISEVKPYRTKIREYVDNFSYKEIGNTAVSDFDLPPKYENNKVVPILTNYQDGKAEVINTTIENTYPWKFWLDNHGYEVTELRIVDSGAGYYSAPEIIIQSDSGSGAKAKAFLNNGSIRTIVLESSGSGYLSAPTIIINGGFNQTGRPAKIVAVIGNGVVRSTHIGMKFDRLSKTYTINDLEKTETYIQTGTKLQFNLKWPPDLRIDKSSVKINGLSALRDTYSFSVKSIKGPDHTKHYGVLTFDSAPELNSSIEVKYLINWNVLDAVDRIQFYYESEIGQPGKELSQLMTGIDYGGALINGFDFKVNYGWDTSSSFNDVWDGEDNSFKDYVAIIDDSFDYKFNLPYVPSTGTELNVYYSQYFSEAFTGLEDQTTFTFDVRQQSPTALITSQSGINVPIDLEFKGLGIPITNIVGTGSLVTVTFATRSQPPFEEGQLINITGVQSVLGSNTSFSYYNGIRKVFTVTNQSVVFQGEDTAFYGSGGVITFTNKQVIDVDSTANIVSGMKLLKLSGGSSYVIATIKSVINNTLLEIDNALDSISLAIQTTLESQTGTNTLTFRSTSSLIQGSKIVGGNITAAMNVTINIISSTQVNLSQVLTEDVKVGTSFTFTYDTLPAIGEDIKATFNAKGSNYLSVQDTSSLKVNDFISLVELNLTLFSVATRVDQIINGTLIKLSNVLYGTVLDPVTARFRREIEINPKISIANVGYVELNEPLKSNETLTISSYLAPVRIDGEDNAMDTIIADGISNIVEIPNTFAVNDLDKFIIRESTSDGSIEPLTSSFDTKLDGGNLAYTTASGLAADDIIVDGDGFVTPTTSAYPEEVVPGQIVDTLAIKVFDTPTSGSAKILVKTHNYQGGSKVFSIGQQPNSPSAVIVKVLYQNNYQILTAVSDYTVDYRNFNIEITTSLNENSIVVIYSVGFSGSNIIGFDYFVGDGATKEFVTDVKWTSGITSYISVDGQVLPVSLFRTDDTYANANRVGFRFIDIPANQSLITFLLINGVNNQTFALTNKQIIETTDSLEYDLDYLVGNLLPNETNMIVRVGDKILNSPKNYYYTVANDSLIYTIDPGVFAPNNLQADDVVVIADNKVLIRGIDYEIDPSVLRIVLYQVTYLKYTGKELIISISEDSGYFYIPPVSRFDKPKIRLSRPVSSDIEVISFFKNDILDIKTNDILLNPQIAFTPDTPSYFTFRDTFGGKLKLEYPVIGEDYIWIIKNEILLTPGIDYILNTDYSSITLAENPDVTDKIKVITFSNKIYTSGISYMQFKDMLNRTSYTRLSLNKQTKLVADLRATDKFIQVEDASNFDIPNPLGNKPGIIEIRGERIEYFTLEGNVLGQLRRGTLGTGVPKLHKAGSFVQDIGTNETIFYTDTILTQQVTSTGSSTIGNLNFSVDNVNQVEVFIGGYNIKQWMGTSDNEPGKSYVINDIVHHNGYYYKCKTSHVSSDLFIKDLQYWDYFVPNTRLIKNPYSVYNVNKAPNSPEGDVNFPADFIVNASNNSITLTTPVDADALITIVKRTGRVWDSVVNIMDDKSKIGEFLRATPGISYSGIDNYALTVNIEETFDNSDVTFDDTDYKVD